MDKKEKYIAKALDVHSGLYDYSKTQFRTVKDKCIVTCRKHGDFTVTMDNHINNHVGCPKCSGKYNYTNEEWINQARKIHGNVYDYTKTNYISSKNNVIIICHKKDDFGHEHGEFVVRAGNHLSGIGCPRCSKKHKMSTEEFIEKAKKVHNHENLDYSEVVYVNNRTKVKIIDRDLMPDGREYGEYWQTPSNHLKGQSHPLKRKTKISKSKSYKQADIIRRFNEVHVGENLDYSKVKYVNMHTPVCIICHEKDSDGNEYGEFWQEPVVHLKGCTHPRLAIDRIAYRNRYTTEEFIEKCKQVHRDDDYDYSQVDYTGSQNKVSIFCNKVGSNRKPHGFFEMNPDALLQGKGCPKCGNHLSYAELNIYDAICERLGKKNVVLHDKSVLGSQEIDIYVPSLKIGIEYNGLRWHSERFGGKGGNYHLNKTTACNEKGVKLIQVFEDEFVNNRDLVICKILHILRLESNLKKIGARKCSVNEIEKNKAEDFLDKYHIQGFSSSSVYIGAYHEGVLVGVMSFTKRGEEWELTRYATKNEFICQGLGGKLFSYFVKNYKPLIVKSFADRRWTIDNDCNLYTRLGFVLDKVEAPDYSYYKVGIAERKHKFLFRKNILHRKYGLPLTMSEREMTEALGYDRIWNCGLLKYVWRIGL